MNSPQVAQSGKDDDKEAVSPVRDRSTEQLRKRIAVRYSPPTLTLPIKKPDANP